MLMQHGGTLENPPFRVTLYINAKAPIEQLLNLKKNMDQIQKTSIKTNILPKTQALLKKQLLVLVQN